MAPMRAGGSALTLSAMAAKASRQLAGRKLAVSRSKGRSSRCVFKPSTICRALSEIHSSFTASFRRGRIAHHFAAAGVDADRRAERVHHVDDLVLSVPTAARLEEFCGLGQQRADRGRGR